MYHERDTKIDILRFIAIICIIIAHSGAPTLIFQLRNFDVILMVLLLGTSFYLSQNNKISYINYIYKRFKRLIIPTWTFLTLFFVLFLIISLVVGNKYYFNLEQIITSYALVGGIGFVWIMKVFFIVAIISPIILGVSKKIKSNQLYWLVLISLYVLYSILLIINNSLTGKFQNLFDLFIVQGFGYGLIAAIGIRLKLLNRKEIITICMIFFFLFVFLMFKYDFISTQQFKYPPKIYYISYGLFMSFLLYILLDISQIHRLFNNKGVFFLSKNSLWLYFWHIIPIYILDIFGDRIPLINNYFITRFVFIFIIALFFTYIHENIKHRIKLKNKRLAKTA
ncbi:acyltransferase [Priestia endophytica]|uniref:acyltransferase family protein n=1 Tax=Priestia endophytica TaxID=135735 RepID=UPI003D2957AB